MMKNTTKTKLTKNEIIALIEDRQHEAYRLWQIIKGAGKHPGLAENYFGEYLACNALMMKIRGELEI
jgi:hypothetical protein